MSDVTTLLDAAHAAVSADPENEALRLRFFERLADGEMVLLLERNKVERALEIAQTLEVDVDGLPQVGQAAFAWAQESMQQTSAE